MKYGEYRMINLDKSKAQFFYDYAVDKGAVPVYGVSGRTPMLLTWEEAVKFSEMFSTETKEEDLTTDE